MQLQSGQNVPLKSDQLTLSFQTKKIPLDYIVDYSCFALTAKGTVRGDSDFIFFNNLQLGQAVTMSPQSNSFTLNLTTIPEQIEKLAFCLSLQQGDQKGQTASALQQVSCIVDKEPFSFNFDTTGHSEIAIIVAEIYRHGGIWKFRAKGQGFNGGLGPLAENFGVDIGEAESTPQKNDTKPINLSKITLAKSGDKISLEKKRSSLGKILVNLKWQNHAPAKSGFFGNLLKIGAANAIDLDLGCLFEFKNGYKGVVQALGNSFGSLSQEPYIELDSDDRTGNSLAGETLCINGKYWDLIERILIYTFIYEGAPSWNEASAKISIKVPEQPEIIINIDNSSCGESMCAIALLQNVSGTLQIRKDVKYFSRGHSQMDKAYNWGMRWTAGHK